jgi:hypothetical protein
MEENLFFSEEEEKLFGEGFRELLATRHPNPDRIGCPDTKIIRDLAFHLEVPPEIIRKVTSHMMKCSECVCDALEYAEEYKKTT